MRSGAQPHLNPFGMYPIEPNQNNQGWEQQSRCYTSIESKPFRTLQRLQEVLSEVSQEIDLLSCMPRLLFCENAWWISPSLFRCEKLVCAG